MAQPNNFKLGQTVELLRKDGLLKPLGSFEIIRVMPTEHAYDNSASDP